MKIQIWGGILLGITHSVQADVFNNYLDSQTQEEHSGKPSVYIGMSVGRSTLKPKANVEGARVDDKFDTTYKFQIGYKFNKKLAIEGFYADMGSAGVHVAGNKGEIDYRLYGLSGIYTHQINKRLNGLIKLGYAKVNNTASNEITYRQVESGAIFGGVGVEYIINPNLSIRGEYEYFDKDINLISVGANWNLGL